MWSCNINSYGGLRQIRRVSISLVENGSIWMGIFYIRLLWFTYWCISQLKINELHSFWSFIFSVSLLKYELISFCSIFICQHSSSVCCRGLRRQNVKNTADEIQKIWTEAWSTVWKTAMLTSIAQTLTWGSIFPSTMDKNNGYPHCHCRRKQNYFVIV